MGLALTPVAGCRGHNGKIRRMNWVGGTRYAEQQGWLTARSPTSVGSEPLHVFDFATLPKKICFLMAILMRKRKKDKFFLILTKHNMPLPNRKALGCVAFMKMGGPPCIGLGTLMNLCI